MQRFTDQQYLKNDQYRTSSNLDARIEIHKRFSTNPQGWFNWVFDMLVKLPANSKILELGCGSAAMWKECTERIPAGWVITLSDLSDGMLDAAWRNLVVTGRSFKFQQMDAQSIPYGDKSFDAVIANHMLYHVPDRRKALGEIKRVLKDDGRLIATTVGNSHMQEMYQWLHRVNTNARPHMFTNPFMLENGKEQLSKFFSKIEVVRYPDSLRVTDVDVIMKYIRSSISAADLSAEELVKIENELTAKLVQNGEIFISKDSGLFEAIK